MAENIHINGNTKQEKYESLIPQIRALVEGESDRIANISNILAALKYSMDFFWVGIYEVKGGQLVLGPFQGPVACTRIALGKGVCGSSWKEKKTILVEDVDQFPGHIACSSLSRSEVVIPGLNKEGDVIFVLDVDSEHLAFFDTVDQQYLEEIVHVMEQL